MGNPHLVCLTDAELDSLDLSAAPQVDAGLFPEGVNVEFVTVLSDAAEGVDGHIRLRVFERGVGETRSCGTGACAAAYAALVAAGAEQGTVRVDVPGGRLTGCCRLTTVQRTWQRAVRAARPGAAGTAT